MFAKNTIEIWGFNKFVCFCCFKRRKRQKTMIPGICGFVFFWSKNGRFVVFWGCALFGLLSCQKKEILDTHHKRKFWLITEKPFFEYFWFFLFLSFFVFFCFFFFFLAGWRVRWGHLALNPPYLLFFLFLFLLFLSLLLRENSVSTLKRAILFISQCLPLFLLSLFWPPPLSLSLSLSLSLFIFSFFLPSCLSFLLSLVP